MTNRALDLTSAIDDFRRARRRADMEEILARLTGKSADLLSFEDVRRKLQAHETRTMELRDIPLDAIVGSVGRYYDFTRSFLPRHDSDAERWSRVEMAVTDLRGMPPITVYQVGQAYFVDDGHHRVSVARQLGATTIRAYVTEVHTKVPLCPQDQPDDLILKAEYTEFLAHTHLDELRPEADLSVTVPGQYPLIEEHIRVHQHIVRAEHKREVSYSEAAAHWHDEVYWPVVQVIRERGLLRDFPGRTEADLYVWISEHRAALEQASGWQVHPATAAADLAAQFSPRPKRVITRLGRKVMDAVWPEKFAPGPPPGQWRKERLTAQDRLFADILVPVNGQKNGWHALEQALDIARREGGRLRGLHVVSEAHKDSPAARAVQAEFKQRCDAAGIPGELTLDVGRIAHKICERARWTDLVVVNLAHPPGPQPIARLRSGFRSLLHRCSRPVLTVPGRVSPLERALLAYDGSPKADEALFVATYLSGQWGMPLVVVTTIELGRTTADTLARARAYLEEHGVKAQFVKESGPVAAAILQTAERHQSNLIIMGGYGFRPEMQVVLGSSVDQVLRQGQQPVLICR